ncbi:MAG: IPT/TIG domain-containing protein, partial [Solirubrobacterales bacterium]|nr:IPT/TIG domain-containing protein [Solirubrobacterales bacterium]
MNWMNGTLGRKTRGSRAAFLGLLVAAVSLLLGAGNAAAATVTVGSPLTASFGSTTVFGNVTTTANTALPEPGANVVSPVNGTIVRWRITAASGGPFYLRVLTPAGGSPAEYTGAGTSAPETPSSMATQTFSTNMPIRAGQTIGLNNTNTSDQEGFASVTGAKTGIWSPPLGNGETRASTANATNEENGFNADVQPYPSVSSVSPTSGPASGGTSVTIIGHNFDGTTAVNF